MLSEPLRVCLQIVLFWDVLVKIRVNLRVVEKLESITVVLGRRRTYTLDQSLVDKQPFTLAGMVVYTTPPGG